MLYFSNLPQEQLPFSKKNSEWRKKHVEWADKKSYFYNSATRKSLKNKIINCNLLNGKIDMNDMMAVINPENVQSNYIPDSIQHYPIINSKLNLLKGEEAKRPIEARAIITNPTAITEIDNKKKEELLTRLQQLIEDQSVNEEEFKQEVEKLQDYFKYSYKDFREIRANYLLNHYKKELDFNLSFNNGFMDVLTYGEEIYQCDIVGGEPTLNRLNPKKVHVLKNGYSSKMEDADIIILDDFWSPGKIIDTYYDVLTPKDIKYIDSINQPTSSSMENYDERRSFVRVDEFDDSINPFGLFSDTTNSASNNYYDNYGNIRVLKMFWKSKRMIKKVKFYNPQTGKEDYDFFPETYKINKALGEEETILWINEAWEGTKIGKDLYVNMRPRLVQYNTMSNPSRCHFGIIGTMYSTNDSKPFSMVDMMKPYSYYYDAIHDRLNKAIAANWGKIVKFDLANIPKGWEMDKVMYYAKIHKMMITDSFKEGNKGLATGKLAGQISQQSSGVIDAETGQNIKQYIDLLEYIKNEMSEICGVSKQREGQISSRETVGGVERSVLQSSNITEWLYLKHDNTKKRVLECFLETAKIALKGKNKKFNYILPDHSTMLVDIDGDEFAECDYGIVIDGTSYSNELKQKLDQLAQAAIQNQALSFSTIMKIYTNSSLAEVQRMIETDEAKLNEQRSKETQMMNELENKKIEDANQLEMSKIELENIKNIRDNQTKLILGSKDPKEEGDNLDLDKFNESVRQFNEKLKFEKNKFSEEIKIKKTQKSKTN